LVGRGCRVVLVSDMYLPVSCIESILQRAGVQGYKRLYLSSATGLTKSHGTVWQRIRADFGMAREEEIIHLGENPHSDGSIAQRYGVRPFLLTEHSQRIISSSYRPVGNWLQDACQSLLSQSIKKHQDNPHIDPYWLVLAYLLVVPATIGMAGFVKRLAEKEKNSRIFFLARDGLIFQKAFEAAWREPNAPPSRYVWCSRRCLNMAMITKLDDADIDFLVSGAERLAPIDYIRRIDLDPDDSVINATLRQYFPNPQQHIVTDEDCYRLRAMFAHLAEPIYERAHMERAGLYAHLDEVGLFKNHGVIVDLGWHGSLQRSLINLGQCKNGTLPSLTGAYFGAYDRRARTAGGAPINAYGWIFEDGLPVDNVAATVSSTAVTELLFSAPESGIRYVALENGRPKAVRIDESKEAIRLKIAAILHDAVEQAARTLRPHVASADPAELRKMTLRNFSTLLSSPSLVDIAKFRTVPHADGFGIAAYQPIIPPSPNPPHPSNFLHTYKKAFWPRGFLAGLPFGTRQMVRVLSVTRRLHQSKLLRGILKNERTTN
jgi:hypothetical protein